MDLFAKLRRLGAALLLLAALAAEGTVAQDAAAPAIPEPIRTDSPRDTLATFVRLAAEMEQALLDYTARPSFAKAAQIGLLTDQLNALIDLVGVPASARREVGVDTYSFLMDIFGRIGPPDLEAAPDVDAVDAEYYRIPETPLYIQRITEGPREGEFLFSAATVQTAPRFFRAVRPLPLNSALDIESFTAFGPQLTGPAVPPGVVRAIPAPLKLLWLDTPLWKALAMLTILAAALAVVLFVYRALGRWRPESRRAELATRLLLPALLLLLTLRLMPWVGFQLNTSGAFATSMVAVTTLLAHVGYAWLWWLGVRLLFEFLIPSAREGRASLDANLLRLASGVLGIVGVIVALAFGGQAIGLPIISVLAGLGIGGLAVALALRSTLENLIGGVMLFVDRPVRVGDFCRFGEFLGTVEGIGVRSTTLRALDRTLISVPNAQFADMHIVNFARCDQLLINEVIGVRYETRPDQLRYLLASLRRMLHAHPRIDSDTVRVRFAGYGESALKIDMRVYADTREWNDFFAIREDVFLRIYDLVTEAGTGFAFPSQTLYLGRDGGLDATAGERAEAAVTGWRRNGRLPFPRMTREEMERLAGTLDYPPRGSAEIGGGIDEHDITAEPLSGDTEDDGDDARRR